MLIERLRELAAGLRPLPSSVSELATAVCSGQAEIAQAVKIVDSDPVLVAALLRQANSAVSAPTTEITTTRAAVTRLGLAQTVAVATLALVGPQAQQALPAYRLESGELWHHALTSAQVAEVCVGLIPDSVDPGVVTAALLHDVGQVLLDKVLDPDPFIEATERHETVEGAERELLGIDHAEAGAIVLESWKLPNSIIEAVRFHHDPHLLDINSAHIVQIASHLGRELLFDTSSDVDARASVASSFVATGLDQTTVIDATISRLVPIDA